MILVEDLRTSGRSLRPSGQHSEPGNREAGGPIQRRWVGSPNASHTNPPLCNALGFRPAPLRSYSRRSLAEPENLCHPAPHDVFLTGAQHPHCHVKFARV